VDLRPNVIAVVTSKEVTKRDHITAKTNTLLGMIDGQNRTALVKQPAVALMTAENI
jgi:hypothetical protein